MPGEHYTVVAIQPEWVLEPEALGSKKKFWYRSAENETDWLFKYPQADTGQHWAEKIAAEVADRVAVLHATVELAEFQGERGSTTESFARDGRELVHGNQLLSGLHGYDPEVRFRQSSHTLGNIFLALEHTFPMQMRCEERNSAWLSTSSSTHSSEIPIVTMRIGGCCENVSVRVGRE